MYLHCHSCEWEQDDYWNRTYNPFKSLLNWEDALLTKDLDTLAFGGIDNGSLTWKEIIINEIEHAKIKIQNMRYRTHEEAKSKNKDWTCPICHQKKLDED